MILSRHTTKHWSDDSSSPVRSCEVSALCYNCAMPGDLFKVLRTLPCDRNEYVTKSGIYDFK